MKNLLSASLFLISLQYLSAQQKTVDLSALPMTGYNQEILQPVANHSMCGDRMRVAKLRFDDGISVHAPFTAFVYVGKKATKFTGLVGIDDATGTGRKNLALDSFTRTDGLKTFFYTDEKTGDRILLGAGYARENIQPGSAVISIYGDGNELWGSGVMKGGDEAKKFELDISNIAMLQVKVTDAGDGISGDIADLGLLRIETTDPGSVQFVSENYPSLMEDHEKKANDKLTDKLQGIPLYKSWLATKDWLIERPRVGASVSRTKDNMLVLSNGLISRTITTLSNAATVSLKNLITGEEFIRSVQPEAIVKIDGQEFNIGGLAGQVNKGYLLEKWLNQMYSLPGSFQLSDIEIKNIEPPIQWKAKRWLPSTQWKATGKELILSFTHPAKPGIVVAVHHKIYDGIPLISKSICVINNSSGNIMINSFAGEIIAFPEKENFVSVPTSAGWSKPNFYIENDYAFNGMSYQESDQSISWEPDPSYTSQANYLMQMPCIVKSKPLVGPSQMLAKGQSWNSFSTYVLLLDGTDRERNTLSQRKMYRLLAPWATENPIFMHLTSTKPEVVKEAVDQCVVTGYELIILSFGSGLNMEDTSAANLAKFKQLAGYAHSKGIQLGGYSLFSSRSISPHVDVIDLKTGKPGGATFGNAPCLGSQWGIDYLKKIQRFFEYTGFDLLEHDGPYPGDFCASKEHPGHTGYYDSQWKQWKQSTDFYQSMLKKDIYTNVPDFYILSGSRKTGIGYREVNWSLPRAQQIVLGRQNLYDGTWLRTPSMGWTFVPLVQYQGGGAAATLEPLSEHLTEYAAHMQQNYGSGVQACYRGNRLYDTEATKELVIREVAHYKKYRDILNADIIHLRRPDGRDWDGMLHVDPMLRQKGYAMLYNPLDKELNVKIKLPLYYTGIRDKALVSVEGKPGRLYQLDKQDQIEIMVRIPADGNTSIVLEQGK